MFSKKMGAREAGDDEILKDKRNKGLRKKNNERSKGKQWAGISKVN